MAITKILNINSAEGGNPGIHLKHALSYIQNPDKTNENILVGSINCLPETAFEQMMETKKLFGKSGKRQGYHIVISFPPKEATPEQAMEVIKQFAEEHLGENYEGVYAVHTDKEHCHGHIIWNSVSLVNGYKYESPKGNWKRVLQPLTNRLCKEQGLSIMPAEYAEKPKNLPRKEWELEQKLKEMILQDAVFCMGHAGSEEHFKFLMRRIGYDFEYGKYLSVKVPGRKWYHQLDKLDERFSKEYFPYYVGSGVGKPKFYIADPYGLDRRYLSPYQRKFYNKIYRMRMVEQKRFDIGSAWFAEELQRFHQLQKEYLFLVYKEIESVEDLIWYRMQNEMRKEEIQKRQQELYRINSSKKRRCKTVEDIREYQILHMNIQSELDKLKQEKKEIKENLKIVEGCLKENLHTASWYITNMKEYAKDTIELPEYTESQRIENTISHKQEKLAENKTIEKKLTYEDYCILTPKEKIKTVGFTNLKSFEEVNDRVRNLFTEFGHKTNVDEIMAEAETIYKEMRTYEIKLRVDEILQGIQKIGYSYQYLTDNEKVELFRFQIGDSKYNLDLYLKVIDVAGVGYNLNELHEDYQKIYDKTVEKQEEMEIMRKESRGR